MKQAIYNDNGKLIDCKIVEIYSDSIRIEYPNYLNGLYNGYTEMTINEKCYLDEENHIITESKLKSEFEELKVKQPEEYNYSFYQYILNCTSKNGTLIEL